MSEVVTGDAVVVEVRVAQMPSRAVALIIDLGVQIVFLIGVFLVLLEFSPIADNALLGGISILFLVLVAVGYPVIFETVTRGRSLGKMVMGLRVVSDDGGPERFRQALFRGLAGMLEFWAFYGAPALISSLVSERGKRLGDIFAGTIVISERGPRDGARFIVMPPPLAAWAATLELSQLPDEVVTAARQYLTRWHDLAPGIQHEMGVRIATQVAAFVSPTAPYGVPPRDYLSAVLAERRRRDEVRLAQRANRVAAGGRPGPYHPPYGPPVPGGSGTPYAPPAPYTPSAPYAPPGPYARPGAYLQPQPYVQPGQNGQSAAGPYAPPPGGTAPEPPRTTPGGFAPPE